MHESLNLHPLSFLEERGEVVIGRTDVDSYAVFPADGAELLRRLAEGRTPADAAAWYRERYAEPVDIEAFVAALHELDFVGTPMPAASAPLRWQRLGRALFSAPAWLAYAALAVAAVAVWFAHPALAPHQRNVFFSRYLVIVELSMLVGQLALSLVHEAFHALAARRIGVNCRVQISRRFYFVVFETVLDGLVVVPRGRRYLPMLAGMLADVLAIALLTLLASATGGALRGIALALAFTTLPRIAWQFYFYLRTDLYHLVATLLGTFDLDGATRALVRNALRRRPRADLGAWHPRDVAIARRYAPLHVLGYLASTAMLALVVAPLGIRFFRTALDRLTGGPSSAGFWDSTLLLTLTLAELAFAAVLALRSRKEATA